MPVTGHLFFSLISISLFTFFTYSIKIYSSRFNIKILRSLSLLLEHEIRALQSVYPLFYRIFYI